MLAKVLRSLLGTRVEDRDGAFAAWQRGDLHDAEAGFRRAIASGRDSADLYHGLGAVAFRQGKLDEAVQALQLAVEREPRNAGYQLELGRTLAYADGRIRSRRSRTCARPCGSRPASAGIEAYLYGQVTAICDWDAAERAVTDLVAHAQREPGEVWTQQGRSHSTRCSCRSRPS